VTFNSKKIVALACAIAFSTPAMAEKMMTLDDVIAPAESSKPAQKKAARAASAHKPERKAEPRKKQPLPGLGTSIPGAAGAFGDHVVRVGTTRTEVLNISSKFPNRIATPFANPKIFGVEEGDQSPLDISVDGSSVFVLARSSEPTAIFVKDGDNGSTVGLMLVPQTLPPQTLVLQLDQAERHATGQGGGEPEPVPNTYTDHLRALLRPVAQGKTPTGCTMARLTKSTAKLGDVMVSPITRFSCGEVEVYGYEITNGARGVVELREDMLAAENVRAVAFHPHVRLYPNTSTMAYVVADAKGEGN